MSNTAKPVPAVVADNEVALGPDALGVPDNTAAKQSKPPLCKISAKVTGSNSLADVKLNQEPGALLAVLGDRSDTSAEIGEDKDADAYSLTTLNDLMGLALAGEKLTAGPLDAQRVNAMLQQMSAFEPTDELEAMIAMQAVAMHRASIDSARRGLSTTRSDHRAQYLGQANKCSRTFAALLEQLNRHRGKTTTQKFVFETHVADGGQAVVGAAMGVGHHAKGASQPHGNTNTGGSSGRAGYGPSSATMRSADAVGDVLSSSCGERSEAMPHAWRSEGERRAEGQSQRPEAWTLHGGGDANAPAGESDAPRSAQPAGVSK